MNLENIAFELILNGGDARSACMEAIYAAKDGDFETAEERINHAEKALSVAHKSQTSLIHAEASGEKQEIGILMIHAQDHFMNASTLCEIAKEIIDLHKKLS